MQFDTTLISTFISIFVSVVSTITFNFFQRKKEMKDSLDKEFSELLKLALEYPYLENPHFTNYWKSQYENNDEKH